MPEDIQPSDKVTVRDGALPQRPDLTEAVTTMAGPGGVRWVRVATWYLQEDVEKRAP